MRDRQGIQGISNRKREFAIHMAVLNCTRGAVSSVVLSVLIPVLIVFMRLHGTSGIGAMLIAGIAETMQLIALPVLFYIVRKNEQDYMTGAYKIYYCFTLLSLCIISLIELRTTGNMLLYCAVIGYYMFVPVFGRREQKLWAVCTAAAGIVGCVLARPLGTQYVIDMAVAGAVAVLLGRYTHERSRSYERMKDELREKTISAEQDPLTGLVNRRGLARRANILWPFCTRAHSAVGIIEIDVDYFKKYNDKFGHPEGDECLKRIGYAIQNCTRTKTDIAARTGGEEFLVFVQDMSNKEIVELALEIRTRIAELEIAHAYVGVSKYVTVSMGVSYCFPDEKNSFGKLYKEADEALYTAKENGRNCIVCDNLIYGRMKNGLGTVINS